MTTVVPGLDRRTRRAIYEHVYANGDHEVGGVLVGHFEDGPLPIVTGSVAALEAEGLRASVTFTHEAWATIHQTMERDYPSEQIVGWYHSHPGFGIFLSDYDRFIHQNFFSEPRQIAYVVDPHAGSEGVFHWKDGELVLLWEGSAGRRGIGRLDGRHASREPEGQGPLVIRENTAAEAPPATWLGILAVVVVAAAVVVVLLIVISSGGTHEKQVTPPSTTPTAHSRPKRSSSSAISRVAHRGGRHRNSAVAAPTRTVRPEGVAPSPAAASGAATATTPSSSTPSEQGISQSRSTTPTQAGVGLGSATTPSSPSGGAPVGQ